MNIAPTLYELQLASKTDDPFFRTEVFNTTKKYVNGDTGLDSNPGTEAQPYRTIVTATTGQVFQPNTETIIQPMSGSYTVPNGGFGMLGFERRPCIVRGDFNQTRPVIDALPYTLSGHFPPDNQNDIRVRQVFDVPGDYCKLQWLDFKNGFRHGPNFRGSYFMLDRCVYYHAFEDAIKIAGTEQAPEATNVGLIIDNDVSGYASGGVDQTFTNRVLHYNNYFHDPITDPDPLSPTFGQYVAIGIGMKFGTKDTIVAYNRFRNIPGDPTHAMIELGAPTVLSLPSQRTYAIQNDILKYAGTGVAVSSCIDSGVFSNRIEDTFIGIMVGLDEDVHAANPQTPFCKRITVKGNTLIEPRGAFLRLSSPTDGIGFESGLNKYFGRDQFVSRAVLGTWADFKAFSGTDQSSHLNPRRRGGIE